MALPWVLAGCASPPATRLPDASVWSGRLGLRVNSDPVQSFSAGFELRGAPDTGELLLTSPLGTTVAQVRWSAQGAELQQGGQVQRRASLDELTTELSGTALPVAALFGWLRGQNGTTPGWSADLSQQAQGRVTARRSSPLPTAELTLLFLP
jgi:outer membrane lipoprotein LolB